MRRLSRQESDLMKAVGSDLMSSLRDIGQQAVAEITRLAQRKGVHPDLMPYIYWAVATGAELPRLPSKDQKAFDLMVSIMSRTGTMPNYQANFYVPDDLNVDEAINEIVPHMGQWARQTMLPKLLRAYQKALQSQVSKVPVATSGQVSSKDAFEFLRRAFREILTIRSRMFEDGELLRRVVRALPL